MANSQSVQLTEGFLRLVHIIGDPRRGIAPVIPVSKSTWWEGVKTGRYPEPIRHHGVTMWRVKDIKSLIEDINSEHETLSDSQNLEEQV